MSRVCVKVGSIIPEYDNFREWLGIENHVYIGRHGRIFIGSRENREIFHYPASKWKNPYKIGRRKNLVFSREHCVLMYELWIRTKIKSDPETYNLSELKNKVLGCWCNSGDLCHGEILAKLLKEL